MNEKRPIRLVVLGLSITSSWGNGHATTFRSLLREWNAQGNSALFLERDVPWYAPHRDMPRPQFCEVELYRDLDDLRGRFGEEVRSADAVLVGSYVPDGVAVGGWVADLAQGVTAFYDIDTPVTLAKLERGDYEYLTPELIPRYGVYFSFTGGPTLRRLEHEYGSPMALPLYCSADTALYAPSPLAKKWALGFLGTYSADRQPGLERLLLDPARSLAGEAFVVAGPQYPDSVVWPENVGRIDHLPPSRHREFYARQRFALNLTRADMRRAGYSPSVRLFEAAACGIPIVSDRWEGIEEFFEPDEEILLVDSPEDVVDILKNVPDADRLAIGTAARDRVLREHTASCRARELEDGLRAAAAVGCR